MSNQQITDDQWNKIREFLRSDPHSYIGSNENECRFFIEAVLWKCERGVSWRLLPPSYGKWNTLYKRYVRWCNAGIWERMFAHLERDPDMKEWASSARETITK